MLAADHRWQWEGFCDARSLPRERIRDVKRVAYDGFVRARGRFTAAQGSGQLLIDAKYSSDHRRLPRDSRWNSSGEGRGPLAWATDPFPPLTGAFVKMLATIGGTTRQALAGRWAMLESLQAWCRGSPSRRVGSAGGAKGGQDEFNRRATRVLAEFIAGRTPRPDAGFWKIEARRPGCPHDRRRSHTQHAGRSSREGRGSLDNRSLVRPAPQRHTAAIGARSSGSLGRVPRRKGPPPKPPRILPRPISR